MPRSARLVLAAGLLATAPVALASGLYLKLAEGARPAEGGAGTVTLTLQAVATHDFRLPQTPLFLVDDGSGMRVASEAQPTPVDVPETVRVTPERRFNGSWQLNLPPGAYKVKVRYKLADRTVESNAVRIQVPASASASR
jgi:hypothetical protein